VGADETTTAAPLTADFFQQPAADVAAGLLGLVMTRRVGGVLRRARLVETEAYLGPRDLASHASKGRTARTDVMFGAPGRAYVYFVYGLHDMFNIVTGPPGSAQAVLVRAAEPLDEWTVDLSGPARLARGFEITRRDNRLDLTAGDISFFRDPCYRPRVVRRKRVGIDYAKHWKDRLLRFVDVSSPIAARLRR
jgi:DNA-3-methyladenine glycosylase